MLERTSVGCLVQPLLKEYLMRPDLPVHCSVHSGKRGSIVSLDKLLQDLTTSWQNTFPISSPNLLCSDLGPLFHIISLCTSQRLALSSLYTFSDQGGSIAPLVQSHKCVIGISQLYWEVQCSQCCFQMPFVAYMILGMTDSFGRLVCIDNPLTLSLSGICSIFSL